MTSDEGDNELSVIEEPLSKLAKKYKRERETSSDEDNIPLMELKKRMREPEVNVDSYPSTEHKSVNEVSGQKEVKGSEVTNPTESYYRHIINQQWLQTVNSS